MNQLGFGLLEILAALTLLAICMLALTQGLVNAQQHSVESLWLAHADMQAENIYERMLSNPIGMQQGDYYQMPISIFEISSACNPCMPHEQAAKDLTEWQQQLQKTIPESVGEIISNHHQEIMIHWPTHLSNETEQESEWITYGGIQ